MGKRRKPPADADALRRAQLHLWTDEQMAAWRAEYEAGLRGRDEGMKRAANAKPDWMSRATVELLRLARTGKPFTSEDITRVVGFPSGGRTMHKNNAVGALFGFAAKDGWIVSVRTLTAANGPAHAHLVNEWIGTPLAKGVDDE